MATNPSLPRKNRLCLTLCPLLVFLLGVFLFGRLAFQPSLYRYRNPFPQTTKDHNSVLPIPENASLHPHTLNSEQHVGAQINSGEGRLNSSAHKTISLDSLNELVESNSGAGSSNLGASGKYPVAQNSSSVNVDPASSIVPDDVGESASGGERNNDEKDERRAGGDSLAESLRKCDFYKGSWVRDEEYPLYKPGSCTYVDEAFDCEINGRPDSEYLRWRWKPDACDLPRFDAKDFLLRLRGKRLMLVGDSMNRNQFESILCLLREGLSNKGRMYEIYGHKITKGRGYYVFKFEDYNCTVEFVRSHFLVKEGVRINAQGNSNPTLSIDQIDKTAKRWKRADILVFNTGHWWAHGKTARGKDYYKEGDYLYPKYDATEAYRKALKTWAMWIDENVNPIKQLVFYRGYSSAHFRGGDWDSGGTCKGESQPIATGPFLDNYPEKMKIVDEVIRHMRVPVLQLNITRLTNFRKDGHPSVYGKNVTGMKVVSTRRQDCSHWCLPGVPDAWNELIYANLILQQAAANRYS